MSVAWEHLPQPSRRVPLRLAPAPPARRRPPTAARRRRRLLAVVVAAVLLVGTVLAVRAAGSLVAGSATAGDTLVERTTYVVQPGDTYAGLASRFHEAGDLRSTLDAIVAANGGRDLRPGDRIVFE